MPHFIGIYNDGTQFSKELRNSAFATTDTTGKTNNLCHLATYLSCGYRTNHPDKPNVYCFTFPKFFQISLARTSPHTDIAPAAFSATAQALRVAPEVETSSISSIRLPRSLWSEQAKALATLLYLSSTVDVLA
jgi:hypothetical protein